MTKLYSKESNGTHGFFKIEINVDATALPDLNQDEIRNATYDAVRLIESAIGAAVIAKDPEAQRTRENQRMEILSLFQGPIFMEEIPNGYCSDYCCKHLPWFVVTTGLGRIKIGWRKRVIQIDWSETRGTKTSDELFKSENVTKDTRMIHAWSYDDAKRYIGAILTC